MNRHNGRSTKGWGLLANGHAGQWHIEIDVSDAGDEWSIQFDGPKIYLNFALPDLRVVPNLLASLHEGLSATHTKVRSIGDADLGGITVGRMGGMSISMVKDDEFATRWFLIVAGEAGVAVRL